MNSKVTERNSVQSHTAALIAQLFPFSFLQAAAAADTRVRVCVFMLALVSDSSKHCAAKYEDMTKQASTAWQQLEAKQQHVRSAATCMPV